MLHTSDHTHYVIGTGSGVPQKFDPDASRETLDHSLPYIFAVALQDGTWHHQSSYAPEREHRPDTVELWRKISTVEDPEWTRRYHADDPAEKAFGARAEVTLKSGEVITDELAGRRRRASAEVRRPFAPRAVHRQVHQSRRQGGGRR